MKGMFFFQSQGLGERSMGEVADTLSQGGVDTLLVKAMDGSTWESYWDRGFAPVRGIDDLKTWRDVLAKRSINLVPWVNPRSPGTTEDIASLARTYGAIAREFGRLELDVEPQQYYWQELPNVQHVAPFFSALRQEAGAAKITVDFPGSWGWSYNLKGLAAAADPFVDGWSIQSYWTPAVADRDEQILRSAIAPGKPLDHIAGTAHLDEMATWLAPRKRMVVWVFAEMSRPLYQRLAAYDGIETPGQAPAPQPSPFAVGPGILAAMQARGDEAVTDEGAPILRNAVGKSGRIYTYNPDSNHVAVSEPA